MPSMHLSLPAIKSLSVQQVPAGNTTILQCPSNDHEHNFLFWLFNGTEIIGPGNPYNEQKYKYEVLSGQLHIHNVSPSESGYYNCVSKNINGLGYTVGQVDMIVTGSFTPMDAVKLVAIVLSLLVLIMCLVLYVHFKRDWNKYEERIVVPVDEAEEDEDGGDEVYNSTTTTINQQTPVAGPSRNPSSDQLLYGIDNQGLDTDFNSVFENIQIKSPQGSLI